MLSKLFVKIKKAALNEGELEELRKGLDDPYWRLLMTNEEESLSDFIEMENYVMFSITLMFSNFTFMFFCSVLYFDQITDVA